MDLVKIVHPEAGEAQVPASAVAEWRSSGWAPASEVEPKADPGKGPQSGEQQDDKPSRSRRRSSEGDE